MGWLFHKLDFLNDLRGTANIAFHYLLPCYAFLAIGRVMDPSSLAEFWPLFLFGPLHMFLGFIVGKMVLWRLEIPHYQKRLFHMSIACTNVGEVVVTLVNIIGRTDLLTDPNNPGEDPIARAERGVGLVQLYLAGWSFVLWTLVWNYMQVPEYLKNHDPPLLSDVRDSKGTQDAKDAQDNRVPRSNSTINSAQDADKDNCMSDVLRVIKKPVLIACALGILVALTPMSDWFFTSTATEDDPPLLFIFSMLEDISRGYLPVVWLVVGAELRVGYLDQLKQNQNQGKSLKELIDTTAMTVVFARLVVVPLVNFGIVVALQAAGMISKEPLFSFVVLSAPIAPSSSTFQLIMEVIEAPQSRTVSFTILLMFACFVLIFPISCSVALMLVDTTA